MPSWHSWSSQVHCIYPHNTTNKVHLEAPAYDPDIDGHFKRQENSTDLKEIHSPSSIQPQDLAQQNSTRIEDISSGIQGPTSTARPKFNTEENRSDQTNSSPELEEGEDWENSQFQDVDLTTHTKVTAPGRSTLLNS